MIVKIKDQSPNVQKFIYKVTEEKGKLLSYDLCVPVKVNEATTFFGFSHIKLKNGHNLSVSGNNASISLDEGNTWSKPKIIAKIYNFN